MSTSTGRERIGRQLRHQSVDRIGLTEHFWNSTVNRWVAEGHLPEGVSPAEHFDLDLECCWPFLYKIDPGFEDQIVAEDEDTVTLLDGNGATLRRYKGHDTTPEHIGFSVTDRKDWEEKAKPFFTSSRDRIRFDRYREVRTRCAQRQRFFCWEGVGPFEMMHPFCGHENLLLGMGLDPDWVREMAEHLTDMQLALWETLFAEEGLPDGIWIYDDLAFKGRPFMSPEMFREMLGPSLKKMVDYAHGRSLPVILHSCGFVEPLLPDLVATGIDCLEAMEVKAGMDLLRIHRNYGADIALMGGLDVRPVASNDWEGIVRELESKIPEVRRGNGFIFHSDHSIPESADYESFVFFLEKGRELGTY